MNFLKIIFISAALLFVNANAYADGCPDGELTFNFQNLEVKQAFAIFANFAGLSANIDQSIP